MNPSAERSRKCRTWSSVAFRALSISWGLKVMRAVMASGYARGGTQGQDGGSGTASAVPGGLMVGVGRDVIRSRKESERERLPPDRRPWPDRRPADLGTRQHRGLD